MANALWVLVAILIIAWLLGLGGVFKIATLLIWLMLIVAVVLAVLAFLAGSTLVR